jgi:hypothetical protein
MYGGKSLEEKIARRTKKGPSKVMPGRACLLIVGTLAGSHH